MNRSLAFILSLSLGFAALGLACSDEASPGSSVDDTTPPDDGGAAVKDETEAGSKTPVKDGGADDTKKDASGDSKKDAGTPPPDGALTKAEVQALLNSRCTTCHGGSPAGGLNLSGDFTKTTVGVTSNELPSMKRITAGDKEASYLFHKIRGTHLDVGGSGSRMPKNGPPYLSNDEVDGIGAFIDAL